MKLNGYRIFLRESEARKESGFTKLLLKYLSNPNIEIKEKISNIIQNEKSKKILISEKIFGHQFNHFKDCSKDFNY